MRLFVPLFVLVGCTGVPAAVSNQTTEATPVSVQTPDTTKTISGTVISLRHDPNLSDEYTVLTYLDDNGILRYQRLIALEMTKDLSGNIFTGHVHMSAPLQEGDRFRMTQDDNRYLDITKLETKLE